MRLRRFSVRWPTRLDSAKKWIYVNLEINMIFDMSGLTVASVRERILSREINLRGCVGITTYIRRTLMRNRPYVRPALSLRGVRGRKGVGLVLGRRLDAAFVRYGRGGPVDKRLLGGVLHRLRSCRLRVCCVQVRVGVGELRTELDGLCIDRGGGYWVLELKNTQHSMADHRAMYDLPCRGNEVLSSGHVNSERSRHALQTGFGMLALSRCYDVVNVRGIVLVNCVDGCVGHLVDSSEFARGVHFGVA